MREFLSKHASQMKIAAFLLAISLGVGVASFYSGYTLAKKKTNEHFEYRISKSAKEAVLEKIKQDDELKRCISDSAAVTNTEAMSYDFQIFGLSSPLFEGKNIELTRYDYKKQQITSKEIQINSTFVTAWEWEHANGVWKLPLNEGDIRKYFPIFIGYENNLYQPTYGSNLALEWNTRDSYTNDAGVTFYFWYEPGLFGLDSVQLQTYWPNSAPLGNPLFIQITEPLSFAIFSDIDKNDPEVLQAKSRLREIAKGISFKKQ